jgi:hypothetical protein
MADPVTVPGVPATVVDDDDDVVVVEVVEVVEAGRDVPAAVLSVASVVAGSDDVVAASSPASRLLEHAVTANSRAAISRLGTTASVPDRHPPVGAPVTVT